MPPKARPNELGFYTVALLPPGRYDAQVQLTGFRTLERKGLTLNFGQPAALDFTLEVEALSKTVSVQGGASLLQTAEASQGAVIDNTKLLNLPLNGRDRLRIPAEQGFGRP